MKNKMVGIRQITGILLCVICIPCIVINLTLIAGSYLSDGIPGFLGWKPVICLSGSMEPTFAAGDLIILKETSPLEITVGDVICFLEDDVSIAHRVTEITGQGYQTKGDANNAEDDKSVAAEQLQGVYTGIHFAKLGDFCMFMQTTTGMLLFIVLPLILLVVYDVLSRRKADQKNNAAMAELEHKLLEASGAVKK